MDPGSAKCNCTVCSGHIEFDPNQAAQTIPCPHCGMDTLLYIPTARRAPLAPAPPTRPQFPPGALYCPACGSIERPVTRTQGSFLIEVFLWLILIVPGVLYSLWRLTTRAKACRICGAVGLIPPDSPRALQLQRHP